MSNNFSSSESKWVASADAAASFVVDNVLLVPEGFGLLRTTCIGCILLLLILPVIDVPWVMLLLLLLVQNARLCYSCCGCHSFRSRKRSLRMRFVHCTAGFNDPFVLLKSKLGLVGFPVLSFSAVDQ